MGFIDYIEKLRRKPEKEKERVAVFATAIAFLIIFGIWLISFSENTRQAAEEQDSQGAAEQLEDLKNSIGQDKNSIQDMMQSLPDEEKLNDLDQSGQNEETTESNVDLNTGRENQSVSGQEQNETVGSDPGIVGNGQQDQELPQLP